QPGSGARLQHRHRRAPRPDALRPGGHPGHGELAEDRHQHNQCAAPALPSRAVEHTTGGYSGQPPLVPTAPADTPATAGQGTPLASPSRRIGGAPCDRNRGSRPSKRQGTVRCRGATPTRYPRCPSGATRRAAASRAPSAPHASPRSCSARRSVRRRSRKRRTWDTSSWARIDVLANAFGASLTLKPEDAPYLGFAFGLPLADISVNANDPRIAVDRSGFADIFVQPLKLGWRFPRGDVVTSYAFYAPTGRFAPRGRAGVGRGFWSHQFSLGGAIFAGRERQIRASALLSYDINLRKRDIDIRRGNTLQIQGGAGVRVARIV